MARPRLPVSAAKVTGAAAKNPKRHKDRASPKVAALGKASAQLGPFEKAAFESFRRELPWLKESHRVLVELACMPRGRMLDPDDRPSLDDRQELRRCLGQLGATPADESKVNIGDDEEDDELSQLTPPSGARPH